METTFINNEQKNLLDLNKIKLNFLARETVPLNMRNEHLLYLLCEFFWRIGSHLYKQGKG
jgi:hypothetical protein